MWKFSVKSKEDEWDENPAKQEMWKGLEAVADAAKTGKLRRAKVAYGLDSAGQIIKVVVVFDAKKYTAAQKFIREDGCNAEELHNVGDANKLLENIKELIGKTQKESEEKNMLIGADLKKQEVVEVKNDEVVDASPEVAVEDAQSEQVPAPINTEEPREEASKVEIEETVDTAGDSADVENEESAKEKPELSNDNLPVIQPTDKKAMLCVRDGYALIIMPIFNAESLVVENCKLYLQNLETGMIHIGAGSELKIDKSKLLDATDHGVMRVLRKFTVNFNEDDMKLAFERAKIFMENIKTMVAVSSSMTIQQAYVEVVNFAIKKAKQKKGAKVMEKDIHCKYNEKEQIVSVRDNYLQDVLDEVGAGFTKTVFCKKLCMLEAHYGVSLVIRNRGRYACNEAGNTRFYKFRIVDELLNTGGAA